MSVFNYRETNLRKRKHIVRRLPQSQGESGFSSEFSYAPASVGATALQFAGAATLKRTRSYRGLGGLTTTGAATTSQNVGTQLFSYTGVGSLLLSGAAGRKLVKAFRPSFTGFISLAWDAAAGNPTGYRLYYGTASQTYTGTGAIRGDNGQVANSPIDVGNVLQFTLLGLPLAQTFYFAVLAYNADGDSPLSNELSDTLLNGGVLVLTGAAVCLKAKLYSAVASGTLLLGGAAALKKSKSYPGSGGVVTGGAATTALVSGSTAHSHTASGSLLLSGTGGLKLIKSFTPDWLGFITLLWDAAPTADGYKIYYGTASGDYSGTGAIRGDNNQVANSPIDVSNVTTFTLKGLPLYVTFYFAVTAYNAAGESPKSNEFSDVLLNGVLVLTGAAVFTRTKLFLTTSSGGMVFGGLSDLKRTRSLRGSGVLAMAGSASLVLISGTQTFSHTSSGGLVTSGIAGLKLLKQFQAISTNPLLLGGTASLAKVRALTAQAAALLFGGTSALKKTKVFTGGGVLTTGGAATSSRVGPTAGVFVFTGSGVLVLSGVAGLKKIKLHAATGGLVTGGSAALKRRVIVTIAGGSLVTSGASALKLVKKFAASGGLVTGGAAATSRIQIVAGHFVYIATGGLVLSGASLPILVKSVSGSGVLVFSGAAIITIPTVGIGSNITAVQLMAELATMLLENADFSCSTLWNATEILDFINATQQEFVLRTQSLKRTDPILVVPPTRRYSEPIQTMQIDRITLDDVALERTFSPLLDQTDPKWRTRVGIPRKYHVDHLPKKTFELNRQPPAQLSGSVLNTLGTYSPSNILDINDRLMVPDYCGMYIKFGVLARMLEKDGQAMDLKRADYCRKRFEFGAELLSRLLIG